MHYVGDEPNRKWVTDITYPATAQGWVYLAVVLEMFSRKVAGGSIGTSLAAELVIATVLQLLITALDWRDMMTASKPVRRCQQAGISASFFDWLRLIVRKRLMFSRKELV